MQHIYRGAFGLSKLLLKNSKVSGLDNSFSDSVGSFNIGHQTINLHGGPEASAECEYSMFLKCPCLEFKVKILLLFASYNSGEIFSSFRKHPSRVSMLINCHGPHLPGSPTISAKYKWQLCFTNKA